MGSGDRAMTLVGRDANRNWRELRLSYYGSIGDWDRTPSHRVRPDSPHEFLGLVQTEDSLRRCLGCHTTHARVGPDSIHVSSEQGFSCERCHGPAGNHLDAMDLKFPDPAIARPRLASAERVNALCGQCHSAMGRGITAEDPDLARFQASALPLSRCATEAQGSTMSCLTCHNPHRNAETSPAYLRSQVLEMPRQGARDGFDAHGTDVAAGATLLRGGEESPLSGRSHAQLRVMPHAASADLRTAHDLHRSLHSCAPEQARGGPA